MTNRPIKLMIVIVDLAAGTGSFVRSLASGLKQFYLNEFELHLLTIRPTELNSSEKDVFDHAHSLNLDLRESWRQMVMLPVAVLRARKLIEEVQPDLILGVHTFSNLLSSLSAQGRPVILTDHINLTERQSARSFIWPMRPLMRGMYRHHLAVGVSQAIVDDLRANFDAQQTAMILNGVDIDRIRNAAQEPISDHLPDKFFIAVGRLAPQKDISTLLRAFALARQSGLQEKLVLVGDGPDREQLAQLARALSVADVVHFVGQQANPFPYMNRSRLLAMSSIYEGFGLVLAEALALGVPSVSTDCPSGPAEILGSGEFGLLVPVRDPKSLANALLRLATDESLRNEFIARSDARAKQLSLENMTRQYRDLILKELQSSSRA